MSNVHVIIYGAIDWNGVIAFWIAVFIIHLVVVMLTTPIYAACFALKGNGSGFIAETTITAIL
jgi:hypothetical protein